MTGSFHYSPGQTLDASIFDIVADRRDIHDTVGEFIVAQVSYLAIGYFRLLARIESWATIIDDLPVSYTRQQEVTQETRFRYGNVVETADV